MQVIVDGSLYKLQENTKSYMNTYKFECLICGCIFEATLEKDEDYVEFFDYSVVNGKGVNTYRRKCPFCSKYVYIKVDSESHKQEEITNETNDSSNSESSN